MFQTVYRRAARVARFDLYVHIFAFAALVPFGAGVCYAEEAETTLDEISVTATREARPTKDVPSAITVIGKGRIDQSKMMHIQDAISGTPGVLINSKNGGYDNRLIIRGAGQKATYGVREIMVIRDGVPMTDPDSFTRFDYIDTQDIERIEITKGPGSIYGGGSAGGVIQILSKSVFDDKADNVKVGGGTSGSANFHTRAGASIGDSDAVALTLSRRSMDNRWRRWNEFESSQVSLKHGHTFEDGSALETELAYTAANLQLPGKMGDTEFSSFQNTGKQTDTKDAWKHTGRDSKIWFFNTKYETEFDNWSFKPRFYANHWGHFHPVSGIINDSQNNTVIGTDIEAGYNHQLWGKSNLVGGVSVRHDMSYDAKKYKYADFNVSGGNRISETLSDRKGDLISVDDTINTIYGIYLQETVRPTDGLLVDAALRYDRSVFDIRSNEWEQYSYATANYASGDGITNVSTTYNLWSPRIGASYALTKEINVFGTVAQSDQVPSATEIKSNNSLLASESRNFEIGVKGRAPLWSFDLSTYFTKVTDEIVSVVDNNGESQYQNAGKTDKFGVELAGEYEVLAGLRLGGTYAYSDYTYDSFTEVVNSTTVDRSGKRMPYVPKHQYSLMGTYKFADGFHARVQSDSWGSYYMDNENSESYDGYDFVTSVNLGYSQGAHSLNFDIQNITDKKYAVEVSKSTAGARSYSAGSPRTFMLSYTFKW